MEPRDYQEDLENSSLRNNSIIYLPPGGGKTFIAIRVIKKLMYQLELDQYDINNVKKSFFLVNNVPLVEQQKQVLELALPLRIQGLSSENKVDLWDANKWTEQILHYQVFVMTSQILLNMLCHGYITFSKINLIIFDECHHAVNNHPMNEIMKLYEKLGGPLPRIIGLTSTLLNKNINVNNVTNEVKMLEKIYKAKINTVDTLDIVTKYSACPNEIVRIFEGYDLNNIDLEVIKKLRALSDRIMLLNKPPEDDNKVEGATKLVKTKTNYVKLKNAVAQAILNFEYFGTFGGFLGLLALMVDVEFIKLSSASADFISILKVVTTTLITLRIKLDKAMSDKCGIEKIIHYSSPRVKLLIEILKEYNPSLLENNKDLDINTYKKELFGIIFVKERSTAKILYKILSILKEESVDFNFLNVDYIMGSNINPYSSTKEDLYKKKQSDMGLEKFRNRMVNCIISTSVLEEGIDIPHCTLVIRFDEIPNFRSYVQSKGRARNADSAYVILVPDCSIKEYTSRYKSFVVIEETLNDMLVGKTDERAVQQDCIDPEVDRYTHNDACITINSATSLLNSYCAQIYSSKIATIQPEYYSHTGQNFVSVLLPLSSGLKDPIQGFPKSTIKDAKKSAALKACIELHKIGQLNDHLLPAVNDIPDDVNIEELFFSHWIKDYELSNDQSYPIKINSLRGFESEEITYPVRYYLHLIHLSPVVESRDESCNVIYELLRSNSVFILLTAKPLMKICQFSSYLSSGEVVVDIEMNRKVLELSEKEYSDIKRFHLLVFKDVLHIHQKFISFDHSNGECHLIVAPAIISQEDVEIDWATIDKYKTINETNIPDISERKNVSVNKSDYLHQAISPWYRADGEQVRYIVTEVSDELTPRSPFENTTYESYQHYFKVKYNLDLMGPPNQPLLRVRPMSGKMNALLPRSKTLFTTFKESKKYNDLYEDELPNPKEHLIPEFCIKFNFPGVLWLKATILPSIIHRLIIILQAEELRRLIVEKTHLGVTDLPEGVNWAKLTHNVHAMNHIAQKSSGRRNTPLANQISPSEEYSDDEDITAPPTPERSSKKRPSIANEDGFSLTMKAIDKRFPWPKEDEPLDIDKHFDKMSLLDVQFYYEFINKTYESLGEKVPDILLPTHKLKLYSKRAICPPNPKFSSKIEILDPKPSPIGPQLVNILEALITNKANDIINLERLETLGDSFLKLSASLCITSKFKNYNEGQLTNLKGRIISNKNLYFSGILFDIPNRMKVSNFAPKFNWMTPAFCIPKSLMIILEKNPDLLHMLTLSDEEALSGELDQTNYKNFMKEAEGSITEGKIQRSGMDVYFHKQIVRHKSISDSVEALIGVYLLDGGIESALKIVKMFKILPEEEESLFFPSTISTPITLGLTSRHDVNIHLNYAITKIEEIIGYKFQDPSLLLEAFSHPSYIGNRITDSYQRLEFIGDAVLDFLITCFIYERCTQYSPGDLTDLRSALVNNNTFGCYVVRLGLHKFILTNIPDLENCIIKFAQFQNQRDHVIDDAILYLVDDESAKIAETVEIPKTLGDVFEALAGAIFFDCKKDLNVVWDIFYRIMHVEIEQFSMNIPKQPIRILYEHIHASPQFGPVQVLGKTVMIPLTVTVDGKRITVHGCGQNKTLAKLSSAKLALRMLDISL